MRLPLIRHDFTLFLLTTANKRLTSRMRQVGAEGVAIMVFMSQAAAARPIHVISVFDMKLAVLATVATRGGKRIAKSVGGIDTSNFDAPAAIGRMLFGLNIEAVQLSNPTLSCIRSNAGMYGLAESFYTRIGYQPDTPRHKMMKAYRALQDLLQQCSAVPHSRKPLILELRDINKRLLSILSERTDLRLKPKIPLEL